MKKCIAISMVFIGLCACLPVLVMAHTDVTVQEAQQLIDTIPDVIILDVREESEFCDENGHIPGALNYPLTSGVLQEQYEELPLDADILVVCHSGYRSNQASEFLDGNGFTSVYDMLEGMSAWEGETITCAEEEKCPAELVLRGDREKLEVLRRFRDEVLLNSSAGRALTLLYYHRAADITALLRRYPALNRTASVITENIVRRIDYRIKRCTSLRRK